VFRGDRGTGVSAARLPAAEADDLPADSAAAGTCARAVARCFPGLLGGLLLGELVLVPCLLLGEAQPVPQALHAQGVAAAEPSGAAAAAGRAPPPRREAAERTGQPE
jgi:hypothetical protein